MARKLHNLLETLKDKANLTTTNSSSEIAVLKVTPSHPSSLPPPPHALSTLLSFGHSSRLHATALVRSLSSRLSSTSNPSVALKCLLSLHFLLLHGSFILTDATIFSLTPISGRRSVLNLSSFTNPTSLPLSMLVRWYARLLELLVSSKRCVSGNEVCLLNGELIRELDMLVGVVQEMNRVPEVIVFDGNKLVMEILRMVGEERCVVEEGIRVRVREVKERLDDLGFVDCVEIVCLLRRLEECEEKWIKIKGWDLFWKDVREVKERVEKREEKRGKEVRRGKLSESARVGVDRVSVGESERFGSSSRWVRS